MPNPILDQIRQSDKKYIIGVDEVGYGCIAGPIYVCAFIAPKDWSMKGVKNSKAITSEKKRKFLCEELTCISGVDYAIEGVHPNSDEYKEYGTNVHGALKFLYWQAVRRVVEDFAKEQALIVLDGSIKFPEHPYSLGESISLPKADALIQQVGAASIIAKVHRDRDMSFFGEKFPQYNWAANKGYPTPDHLAALKKYGYCSEHRFDYEPIKSMIKE
jgi:ribonuclease HII